MTSSEASPRVPKPLERETPPVCDVQSLLKGGEEVRLMHRGVEYRLRITRQGRLILTK